MLGAADIVTSLVSIGKSNRDTINDNVGDKLPIDISCLSISYWKQSSHSSI